ncbi:DUF4873 domain-containing protein [Luteipulveratus halotolerans]|uniref:DUF4873 domain-containing protein n=1 Tax=Luteipulveratus halotolerans TaxID=1631356 RepID=A0A0L6CIU4_9MICO|nr:DUF4873 domain-containing protein [Luteipulveratus halotolerans]KNX37654.1 hypothetical protein VV01_11670 [Luteipulveratus halotolerans]
MTHEPGEAYDGVAMVSSPDATAEVGVRLRGAFQPIDGRFHWYGRLASDSVVSERFSSGTTVTLSTPHGSAAGRLSDVDPWGRFRVTGVGRPPF